MASGIPESLCPTVIRTPLRCPTHQHLKTEAEDRVMFSGFCMTPYTTPITLTKGASVLIVKNKELSWDLWRMARISKSRIPGSHQQEEGPRSWGVWQREQSHNHLLSFRTQPSTEDLLCANTLGSGKWRIPKQLSNVVNKPRITTNTVTRSEFELSCILFTARCHRLFHLIPSSLILRII